MASLIFKHDHLLLDACCVLNLYASLRMEVILASIPIQVAISDYVRNHEALNVLGGCEDDISAQMVPVDLQSLVDKGVLKIVSLDNEKELKTYIDLATSLDDGEAITGAMAINRQWALGTDEKKVISLFGRYAPHIQIISTPEIVKHWAESEVPSSKEVAETLRNIRLRARYSPNTRQSLYKWWTATERLIH